MYMISQYSKARRVPGVVRLINDIEVRYHDRSVESQPAITPMGVGLMEMGEMDKDQKIPMNHDGMDMNH